MSAPFLRLRLDKVGSACTPLALGPYVTINPEPVCAEGTAIVCRVLTARRDYGHLELVSGRQARLVPGDIIVGVLGNRAAMRGFSGRVPQSLAKGDTLHLLNQGGVVGVSAGGHVELGNPLELEVLGTPVRLRTPLRLDDHALDWDLEIPAPAPPVLVVAGTCMNSGKSTAAGVIIRALRTQGKIVHAGKVTGVACYRDLMRFADNGARRTLSFLDFGMASTCYRDDTPPMARAMLAHLMNESPDVIVLELGDGLMGPYGVDEVLEDAVFSSYVTVAVLAANDLVGARAGAQQLEDVGIPVGVVTGPATDNAVGRERLQPLGLQAANIFREPEEVCRLAIDPLWPTAKNET